MSRKALTVMTVIIFLLGASGLIGASLPGESRELEGPGVLNSVESPPLIPHSDSQGLEAQGEIYTFDFAAEEGNKIHLEVTATREPLLQVILVPKDQLTEDFVHRSFEEIKGKITEASSMQTRELEAHVTIPEDEEYSLVVRHPSRDDPITRAINFDIIVGRGFFSSIVVRVGGFVELFLISSFIVLASGTGYYLYRRRKERISFEDEDGEWREEDKEVSESEMTSRTEDIPTEQETPSDDKEFLQYED